MTEFDAVFDHHSDVANADPVEYYSLFREQCPVGRTEAHGGFVYTTRYADVVRIARDDATFSSARRGEDGVAIVIPRGPGLEQYPIELDPPASSAYRDLINPLLTPSAVDELRPMITRHATRIVDAFIEQGSADFVRDLTNPLPAAVTLDWLGFPSADWPKLAKPIHDIFAALAGSERAIRGAQGLAYMDQRIRELIALRRTEPAEDAISYLVRHGTGFSDDELVSVIGLLIAGGVDTTTSLTGSTLVHLSRHPDQRRRLVESPDLLENATEEFLRAFAPSQSMARTATTDTEVGGCPVHAGDRVLIPWVAANHDPAVFPDPAQVRLDRDAHRHLSFGIGTHRCAGAHLARAMFHEMMTQVLTRLPDYQVVEDGLIPYPTKGNQTGWDAIPAIFTPGPMQGRAPSYHFLHSKGPLLTPTALTISGVEAAAEGVVSVQLAAADGSELPGWAPGAHVEVRLPSGRVRQYSLSGDPADRHRYRVAVLREEDGRGGSVELHALARPGVTLPVRGPRNHFPLVPAPRYVFLAGGIGITPILAMVRSTVEAGTPFRVVYGGRSRASMAYADELLALAGSSVELVPQDERGLPDLPALLGSVSPDTAIYCCGPAGMIAAVERECAARGLTLYVERFTAGDELEVAFDPSRNTAFDVHLARRGLTLRVPPDKRLIEVIREAVPGLSYDCEKGYCGACETRVLAGTPEHRDSILTPDERAAARTMMICVGRCTTPRLVLDL
ncbi:cytochrome P450/oxidoreductase [Phytohabitans rumicis]|uniref:Cytochrome P450 n=1 Tax=Phytohabitans rumicis TaxID=1076125 RepID=A0A6V8LHT2_9ACTN|nr:cytochrome P450 [Phytohabitans rumicis]GFJ94428.1 hypothetical protein Prum_080700 [Phytohabitans rumicis]